MKRAIATAPGEATKYVSLTAAELRTFKRDQRRVRKLKRIYGWEARMAESDVILPRWAEDLINGIISSETRKLAVDKYNLRMSKPA